MSINIMSKENVDSFGEASSKVVLLYVFVLKAAYFQTELLEYVWKENGQKSSYIAEFRQRNTVNVLLFQKNCYKTLTVIHYGAPERTWTFTSGTLDPKSSASANSATGADNDTIIAT